MTLSIKTPQLLAALFLLAGTIAAAQEPAAKPVEKATEKSAAAGQAAEKPTLPFQIQLLETHVRFEANGDSRKEVHTVVKLNNILGAREFARLAFDYNRGWQRVEIPMVRVTHANGGTSEVLPSAISDAPNPAVEKFPAYHDVRVKSVRILGLQEDDTVEYRVITTTTKHPLAPDFWLEHTFDRSGQVLEEDYELDFPASRQVQIAIAPTTQPTKTEQQGEGNAARTRYDWRLESATNKENELAAEKTEPDVVLTTYPTWEEFASRIGARLMPNQDAVNELSPKAKEIVKGEVPSGKWIALLYDFVSQKIKTVDLPLGTMGFGTRPAAEVLSSGYGTPEDKFVLFASLAMNCCGVKAGLVHTSKAIALGGLPRPNVFDHLLTQSGWFSPRIWMDLNLEIAPFGMIPSQFRGKPALLVEPELTELWPLIPEEMAYASFQKVMVDASLNSRGELSAIVHYTMRGDNELLLRMAFHQTPKERWKDVAGLLAISDGFRGQVTSVNASDPMGTKEPFTVEYEISQPKFVDWAKKPVRIPALLPQIAVPDLPAKPTPGAAASNIELGTPLNVETSLTMRLPPGTTVQTPVGTSVSRDYATFSAKYSATQNTLAASRHINFIAREIPADRITDYNAFLHAVQGDQAQLFTLAPAATVTPKQPATKQ